MTAASSIDPTRFLDEQLAHRHPMETHCSLTPSQPDDLLG